MAEGHIIKIVVSVGKRPSIRERKFGCTRSIDQRSDGGSEVISFNNGLV